MPDTIPLSAGHPEDMLTVTKKPPSIDEAGDIATCPSPYVDFRAGASWRIFRIMAEFIEGFEFLADLKKEVTFLGSARAKPGSKAYEDAHKLGRLLGAAGFTIITGGGPGVMEAGNLGAYETKAPSIGINIQLPKEQRVNPYVTRGRGFYYFFTRKLVLTISAQAYVYFPGGFGTLDELMEILTLIQTKKMCPIPVILVGKEFWGGMVEWVRKAMLANGYVAEQDLKLFTIVDTAEEAFAIIKDSQDRAHF